MADMKASVTLELIEKGFEKADKAAKSLDRLAKAGNKAGRRRGDMWGGDKAARSAEKAARAEARHSNALRKSTNEMRRQRSEAQALTRQQQRLARAQDQAARKAAENFRRGSGAWGPAGGGAGPGMQHFGMGAGAGMVGRKIGGLGLSFLGGMGIGAGVGVGAMAGQAVTASAGDEFRRDQLQVLGDISPEQMQAYARSLDKVGNRRGVGRAGADEVFGGLMSGGLSSEDASAMTDAAIVFAKATQAANDDAARSTVALRNQMGVTADQMLEAYDAIALGGKAGQFEVADMARELPSLLAKMKFIGESGLDGVRNTVAMAQAVRKATGSSAEAATSLENMLDKFTAPDFVANAKKFGINVEKTMTDARKNGLSPAFAVIQAIAKATKGNAGKISKLLPDREAKLAVAAILGDMEEVQKLIKEMESSGGTVMKDYVTATDNASAAWDRFAANVSTKAKSIADNALPAVTTALNAMSGAMEGDGIEAGSQSFLNKRDRLYEKLGLIDPKDETYPLRVRDSYSEYQSSRRRGATLETRKARRSRREAGEQAFDPQIDKAMAESGQKAEGEARKTTSAIENILQSMNTYAAGLKAGSQFAAGLRAAAPEAAAAANSVANSVANHFPQSPAKAGPLRKLPEMGRKISAQLAGGMGHDSPMRAATRIAGRIASEAKPAAAAATGSGSGGRSVQVSLGGISISGVSDPQAAADHAAAAIRRRLDGVLGDVGVS